MFAKILVANDGSDGAFKAFGVALDLAALCQAELHMVCVEEMPHLPTTIDEVVEQEDEEKRRFAPVIARRASSPRSEAPISPCTRWPAIPCGGSSRWWRRRDSICW